MTILLFLFLCTNSLLAIEGNKEDDTKPLLEEVKTKDCLICWEPLEETQPRYFCSYFYNGENHAYLIHQQCQAEWIKMRPLITGLLETQVVQTCAKCRSPLITRKQFFKRKKALEKKKETSNKKSSVCSIL